ncbi:hypothetical protein M0G43_13285 [Subsaxibacter sp. CAU 1640]|uniref:hypothetical protein n=1 Tax=Subsaxibacter sp. CAU 1640 TaxID=2933271 RepID=UPI002004F6B4|nr:hypothetical protein [Subsaxibacter sp. CAU 1640]MCK7591554.1 hypothetical protein [Subsaxibacter sp. CAU 1640]
MIGILLALQVNNWNEERKLKRAINNTLKTISYDLEIDTTFASTIIKFYEINRTNSKRIIDGEITKDNYTECLECLNLVTIYQPFNYQTRGIGQLKTLTDIPSTEKDTLITDITKFYAVFGPLIDKSNERMDNIVLKNFNDLEKFPWFIDMAKGNLTDEVITYFTESEDYKKRVTSHAMLAVGNHLAIAKQYKQDAIELLEGINKRIKEEY